MLRNVLILAMLLWHVGQEAAFPQALDRKSVV